MSDQQPEKKRRRSDLERLDSWKAIANYFSRSVRTVRRWETQENLPVHRHKHAKGSSVFAYTSELEIWRINMVPRDSLLEPSEDLDEPTAKRRSWLSWLPYAVAATALAAVLTMVALSRDVPNNIINETVAPKTLLLAQARVFGNSTESGNSLRAAVRRDLANHHGYRTVRPERIESLLLAMRLDADTELTSAIAIEIAKRDSNIDAVVVPQLESTDNNFVVSAHIIDAENGETIAFPFLEESSSTSALAAASKLTGLIDGALATIPKSQRQLTLAAVTTSSFEALTLYTQAISKMESSDLAQANSLLGMALQHDPEFLSALALQAWVLRTTDVSQSAARLQATDIDRWPLTTNEHLLIEAIRLHVAGDHTAAKTRFEILHNSRPNYPVAEEALLEICVATRSIVSCIDQALQLAKHQPANFNAHFHAARAAILSGAEQDTIASHVGNASSMATRADLLITPPGVVADALLLPALNFWMQGKTELAMQHVNGLRSDVGQYPERLQQSLLTRLADTSAMLGRASDAEYFSRQISDEVERFNYQASSLFAAGNMQQLGELLSANESGMSARSILFATMTAKPAIGENPLQDESLNLLNSAQRNVVLGMRAAKRGNKTAAIERLQNTVATLRETDGEYLFVGHDLLSKLLFERGQVNEAINALERLQAERNNAALNGSGIFWVLCQKQLAHYYRAADREPDAQFIEDRLRNLLSAADENFPAAVALRATS